MTIPAELNEFNYAEGSARLLLDRLGCTYGSREALVADNIPDGNSVGERRSPLGEIR